MVDVSLPVRLSIPSNHLLIDFNRTRGVTFSFSNATLDENKDILAIFKGALYWVNGGSSLPILPNFNPASDSIIFEPFFTNVTCRTKICYPFPKFMTYENLNRAKVRSYMSENVSSLFSWSNEDLLDEFFNNGEKIFCDGGSPIGHPTNLANVIDPNFPIGFSLRTWKDADNELIYPHIYLHHLRFIEPSIPSTNVVYDQLVYGISNHVGATALGGNDADDLYIVRQRLIDLGFSHPPAPTGDHAFWEARTLDPDAAEAANNNAYHMDILNKVITLFQSIIRGRRRVSVPRNDDCAREGDVDGAINKRLLAERWLWASNAPNWQKLGDGHGYHNSDNPVNNEHNFEHDYAAQYLQAAIEQAGQNFMSDYWDSLSEAEKANYTAQNPVIHTNDASWPGGGDTDEHGGHEAGLDVDIRTLRNDGSTGGLIWNVAGTVNYNPNYDRAANRAICQALSDVPEVIKIYFNDPEFVNTFDKVYRMDDHDNHYHVNFCPPSEPIPWDDDLGNTQ